MRLSASAALLASSALSALATPFDFDYTSHLADIGENTYHYLRIEPDEGQSYRGTVFLIHGFPDLSYGWHHQISFLSSLGYRVFAPDMLGYAQTSAPEDLEPYYVENMAEDLASLIQSVVAPGEQIILGGHDWGARLVWYTEVVYPELSKATIGLSVPHGAPAAEYVDLEDVIESGQMLNFGYQLQLREPSFENVFTGPDEIRSFLRGIFGGTTPDGRPVINATVGIDLELVPRVQPAPLLPPNMEDLFVEELTRERNTLSGPLKWYRTMKPNWESEKALEQAGTSFVIDKPVFFACGQRDIFVPCEMSQGMEPLFTDLERHEMNTTHWIQIEAPKTLNRMLEKWLQKVDPVDCKE